jgi:hypothetical protein
MYADLESTQYPKIVVLLKSLTAQLCKLRGANLSIDGGWTAA